MNKNVILDKITVVNEETKVYNLSEVEINHNYFANDVLVHNRACFVKGTMIEMADGTTKPIEDIANGDIVVSVNLETGLKENQTVTNIITPIHDDLVKYSFENGTEIVCTFDHPFFINGFNLSSYRPLLTNDRYNFNNNVTQIEVGDNVNLIDGLNTRITKIEELEFKPTQTYIFEVTNNHNFFANGILTHNKACFISGTKVLMGNGIEKNIEEINVGDLVLSYNEIINVVEEREVTEVNSPIHDDLVKYILSDDTEIISTFDHPFYVNGLKLASYKPKWTNERYDIPLEVTQINIGDKLTKPNREILEIVSITELERINTQTHIISVADNQNFYANGVLVHNK